MKVGKPKSKRTTVRLRHKIEKASAAKQRKDRKEAKKNPQWRSRLKKDPGIPNLFPYKDKVLAEIEDSKRKKEEEQQLRREVARAQREGKKLDATSTPATNEEAEVDEDLEDAVNDGNMGEERDESMEEDTNPMAALLASAQARARTFQPADEEDEEDDEDEEFGGFGDTEAKQSAASATSKKVLPKQALADPIRAVTALVERLEKTKEGIQQLLSYYQLAPLVTANSNTTTRFLVDVARKRGRLGRGGVPNLNAAALTVLGDLNEERLKLPALDHVVQPSGAAATNKGEVHIVSTLAQPFRIEGLFGDSFADSKMDIER